MVLLVLLFNYCIFSLSRMAYLHRIRQAVQGYMTGASSPPYVFRIGKGVQAVSLVLVFFFFDSALLMVSMHAHSLASLHGWSFGPLV
jgi:hypothetical protein